MSVNSIIDPTSGKIAGRYIDGNAPPFVGFVRNPLENTLQCYNPTTSINHNITGANVVNTGTLETANIKSDAVLPIIAPVRIGSDLLFDDPLFQQVQFDGTTATIDARVGKLELKGATEVEVDALAGGIRLVSQGNVFVRKPIDPTIHLFEGDTGNETYVSLGGIRSIQTLNFISEMGQPGSTVLHLENGVSVLKGSDDPTIATSASGGAVKCELKSDGGATKNSLTSTGAPLLVDASTHTITMNVEGNIGTFMDATGMTIQGDPTVGNAPALLFQNTNSGNTAKLNFDGSTMILQGDINDLFLNAGNTVTINGGGAVSLGTAGGTQSLTFGNIAYYSNPDVQLVDPNKPEQIPTNQIAVPVYIYETGVGGGATIDNTEHQIIHTKPFFWRYSGTGSGQSRYCRTSSVEINFNFVVFGAGLANSPIQWSIKLIDMDSSTTYYATAPFHSFDNTIPADGTEYATNGTKTAPSGKYSHSGTLSSIFEGVNITDGNNCVVELWAITVGGLQTIDTMNYSMRIRPYRTFD